MGPFTDLLGVDAMHLLELGMLHVYALAWRAGLLIVDQSPMGIGATHQPGVLLTDNDLTKNTITERI